MSNVRTIERMIVRKVIADALAAGFALDVYDGGEFVLTRSTDPAAILAAMFSTDEDYLHYRAPPEGPRKGWVRFTYGNGGSDVVSDYTTNLEPVMKGASLLADAIEAGDVPIPTPEGEQTFELLTQAFDLMPTNTPARMKWVMAAAALIESTRAKT